MIRMKPAPINGKKKVVFDEPELEAAWKKSAELSKKHKTKFRY